MALFRTIFLFLLLRAREGETFSNGAPMSACRDDMVPRHGFSPQQGSPPIEVVMDQEVMTPDTYLRVTIRSRKAFKGFLLRAESEGESHLGTWYIPYLADKSYLSESQYLHCGELLQSAVTHSGRTNNIWVVSFQWRPPASFSGLVTFRATVVESYRVYWTNIKSSKVLVISGEEENNIVDIHEDTSSDQKEKVIMDRNDMLGDYELISDDDYYDMKVGETRTVSNRQESEGFTVLPILENVIKIEDNPDQTDGSSHDTANENESIDPGKLPHEISGEQTTEVPTRLYKDKSSEKPRHRPSILMTPPVRPRNRKVSTTPAIITTTTTKSSTATTTTNIKTFPTPNTTTTTKVTTTTTMTTTTTTKMPRPPLKTVTVRVEGGIIVNAKRRDSRPRTILEPKFIFTTQASTQPTPRTTSSSRETSTSETSTSEASTTETSTAQAVDVLTTTGEAENTAENTMFSHVFELTKESEDQDQDQDHSDSQTEIVIHTIVNGSETELVMYKVGENTEVTTTGDTKIPTFDDLEVILRQNTTSTPYLNTNKSLPSELYDVKYNENATEVILMGEVTELERMPRDNLDKLEPLEGAYKR